jgi:malonyl-CoA decarboxylase
MELCAHYLAIQKRKNAALDPVAHFHLTNGAIMERLNWLADTSPKGLKQSAGLMVNYNYKREEIDENHERYTSGKAIATSRQMKALLRN